MSETRATPPTLVDSEVALVQSRPLEELQSLNRRYLHLFVCGPGYGEGLAVALPDSGWVLVDACRFRVNGDPVLPQAKILKAFQTQNDPVLALVLTHPHRDHAAGFPDLIKLAAPQDIGVTGNPPPEKHLLEAAETALRTCDERTRSRQLAQTVVSAVAAIEAWEGASGRKTLAIREHERLAENTSTPLLCVAPDEEGIRAAFSPEGVARLSTHANHLSLVFELVFGTTRVILSSDLPRVESTGDEPEVSTGWNSVMVRHPRLAGHCGLKIPHHGSRYAQHPELMSTSPKRRAWVTTPHNSATLPRPDVDEGLDHLLSSEPSLHLTALPVAWGRQPGWAHPGIVSRASVASRTEDLKSSKHRTKSRLLNQGCPVGRAEVTHPLGSVWCFAFSDENGIVGRWRGAHALEVVRD